MKLRMDFLKKSNYYEFLWYGKKFELLYLFVMFQEDLKMFISSYKYMDEALLGYIAHVICRLQNIKAFCINKN